MFSLITDILEQLSFKVLNSFFHCVLTVSLSLHFKHQGNLVCKQLEPVGSCQQRQSVPEHLHLRGELVHSLHVQKQRSEDVIGSLQTYFNNGNRCWHRIGGYPWLVVAAAGFEDTDRHRLKRHPPYSTGF